MSIQKIIQEELRTRIALALEANANEEVEQIDELDKKTLGSYVKKASSDLGYRHGDIERNIISKSGYYGSDEHKKDTIGRRNRRKGIGVAVNKLTSEEVEQIDESTAKMKDGYYVSNQKNSEITHDKPFADSKSAISHANKGENKSGYVHRVHKVKDGKIDKQWEYNGGHMDGGWEHFSDFKGTDAKGHFRSIPKHLIHGAE